MQRAMRQLGVPEAALRLEPRSQRTVENASQAARILRLHGAQSIIVVTSDFHVRRALHLFSSQGFDCIGLAAVANLSGPRRLLYSCREALYTSFEVAASGLRGLLSL